MHPMPFFVVRFNIQQQIVPRGDSVKISASKIHTLVIYLSLFACFLIIPLLGNHAVNTLSESTIIRPCVIIDAGHGGVDGGAVSCTGVCESQINLQIALKLEDLFHLLGIKTVMIRDTDKSVYTEGDTIAAKKVSDIKERVRIANTTPSAIYLSVHQNHFTDPKYHGAQVFYNTQEGSRELAELLQASVRTHIDPVNKRQIKKASGVYLMEHINCTGVLIECGFLSNPVEEANLRDTEYQKKISCAIAATISQYLNA